MADVIAGPGTAGKNCPFCQTPIKPAVSVHICDVCGIPHHQECWQQNQGCTTFGCSQSAAARGAGTGPQGQPYQPPPPPMYARLPAHGYGPPHQPAQYGIYLGLHQGYMQKVPCEIRGKLNWGAFLLTPFWCVAHNVWIGLLCLVPYIGWIIPFVLLLRGNEMAWQSRRFDSVAHFQEVQTIWMRWGVALLVIGLVSLVSIVVIGYILAVNAVSGY